MAKTSRNRTVRAKAGGNGIVDLDKVISAVATTMFVVDDKLVVTNISDATLKALGYSRDEVVGKMTCAELCRTPLCGTVSCTIRACMRTGGTITGETEAQTRDGRKIHISTWCSAIFDDDGKPLGGMEVIFDLTDQKKALAEIDRLIEAAKSGKLDQRADADKVTGDFKTLFQGVNELLDAIIEPLDVAAKYVNRISKGDIPEKITDEYRGDFNEIKNNLNGLIDVLNSLINEAERMKEAAAQGELDTRADVSRYHGAWATIVKGLNDTAEGMVVPMRDIGRVLDRLAAGDSKAQVTADYKGAYNVLKQAANALGVQINLLGQEMEKLAVAAAEGNLDYRGDSSKFKGDFAEIVNGVNRTMEGVVTPLREIGRVLERVAAQDLTARVIADYRGEYNVLKNNLNKAIEVLEQALQQMAIAADQVASASGQISSGSQTLAQGVSEQASSLEEVSSNLQEMTAMTRQNAANAKEARSLADDARDTAAKGVESMSHLSEAIDKIKASSDETAKIVKTIDEIAFQTNLLALNAAVEAARAGDAGKGFAVVAEEVRNLAMRSAEAAKNTANMIEESVKNADNGVALNQKVLKNLDEINKQVNRVGEVMVEIAAASDQQSQGIDQINTAVDQMNHVTQQAAANSEESASAAEELASQAEEMRSMVAGFKLSNISGIATRPNIQVPKHTRLKPQVQHEQPIKVVMDTELKQKAGSGVAGREAPDKVIPFYEDEDQKTLQEF